MEDIKIKHLLKANDGTISYIEFIQDGRTKILSYKNFISRFGAETIKDLK